MIVYYLYYSEALLVVTSLLMPYRPCQVGHKITELNTKAINKVILLVSYCIFGEALFWHFDVHFIVKCECKAILKWSFTL